MGGHFKLRRRVRAEEAGVTLVNEMGLDPGIDHMLAMECIDQAKADGCAVSPHARTHAGLPARPHARTSVRACVVW